MVTRPMVYAWFCIFLSIVPTVLSNVIEQLHIAQGTTFESMTISWLSNDKTKSFVSYGLKPYDLYSTTTGTIQSYNFSQTYQSKYIYHVTIRGMEPDTTYYYSCGYNTTVHSFTTLPKEEAILVGVLGDLGQTADSQQNIRHILKNRDIRMILHAGDLSYADCNPELWDTYGQMIEPLSKKIPWMVGPGNHEIEYTVNGTLYLAFEERYKMPQIRRAEFGNIIIPSAIGRDGTPYCCPSTFQSDYNYGNSFYSFTISYAKVIYLNPYARTDLGSPQYRWLETVLKTNVQPWIIVITHCPWYNSNTAHQNEKQTVLMQQSMEPLFHRYHVNLVITGHVHAYERTYPVYNNTRCQNGTTYITIGDGGNIEGHASSYKDEVPAWSAYRNGTQYGHGTLEITKHYLFWRWYRNVDREFVFRDYTIIKR